MRIPAVLLTASLLILPHFGAFAEDARPVEDAARHKLGSKKNPSLPTIYLVGDSTVRVGTPNQRGWGDELGAFFDLSKLNVVNHAIGGRSSRTFQTEGSWAGSLAKMQRGDFVLIQFGHNDAGPTNDNSRARGTIRGVGEETEEIDNLLTHQHEVVHSYGWYLRKYVEDAKAKGDSAQILERQQDQPRLGQLRRLGCSGRQTGKGALCRSQRDHRPRLRADGARRR